MYGKVVRRATSWNAVKGANEKIVIPIFGALLLAGLFSEDGLARVVGIFSALTIAAVLGPVLLDQVTSRFSYDRPDAGEPS